MKKILPILPILCAALSGCGKDETPEPPGLGTDGRSIVIADVRNIPEGVTFDRVTVEITGFDWQTVATVEAGWDGRRAVLELPDTFAAGQLQQVDRGPRGRQMEGYWPSVASDAAAGVTSTRDEFTAWSADRRVGRLYLTDWPGEGPTEGRMYLGFQWADRPFVLDGFTGRTGGFTFRGVAFASGWNTYAKLNASSENISVITDIPDTELHWRFEEWP